MESTKPKLLKMMGIGIAISSPAIAQPVNSFAELETILTDQILIEDFEGISLHAGGTLEVPNPLNSITIKQLPFNWDIHPGITYESPTSLSIFASFINGDDDIILRSADQIDIRFDTAQIAFGFDAPATSQDNFYTIAVYDRDDALIEDFDVSSANPTNFIGYQSPTIGISRLVVTHPVLDTIVVNNFAFGADFTPCPADINNDGTQNFFDVSAFLAYFNEEDDRADFTDDGQFNFFDVSAFLNAYAVSCP